MTMNPKKGADDSARAKFDNPIRSNYHAPARSSSYAAMAGAIDRSEGQREKRAVVDLLSFDSENELIADGVGKMSLLVSADATVVVHKEDGLVQKNTSVEELRKPTH
ncbi:hypothetical protein BHM03_00062954 [Ensete ventricosum]|nr:hypothetical protein BHM03_00062954 [Ensete ventricosum]